jgi:hypothetical protein
MPRTAIFHALALRCVFKARDWTGPVGAGRAKFPSAVVITKNKKNTTRWRVLAILEVYKVVILGHVIISGCFF